MQVASHKKQRKGKWLTMKYKNGNSISIGKAAGRKQGKKIYVNF